jgi:hypothetical protein
VERVEEELGLTEGIDVEAASEGLAS